jgi:hypothetical protein
MLNNLYKLQMSNKLTAFNFIFFSFRKFISDYKIFLKVALIPFVLTFIAYILVDYIGLFISNTFDKGPNILFKNFALYIILYNIFLTPLFSAFASNWHRYIIFEGKKPWALKKIDFSNYTFKFILAGFLLFILLAVPYSLIIILSFAYAAKFSSVFQLVGIQWIFMLIFIFFTIKLTLILPAAAAGHNFSIKRIYSLSSNFFWRIFIGELVFLIIFFLVYKIISYSVELINPYVYLIIYLMITFVSVTVFATWLSKIYKEATA